MILKSSLFLAIGLVSASFCQSQRIITTDVDYFWKAYDKVSGVKDSALQASLFKTWFIDKASKGQQALFEVRNYQPEQYRNAINNYPAFWSSIRKNTLKARSFEKEIRSNIAKLKALYPPLRLSDIYFGVGVFRTNGTIKNDMVLIGTEMALSDKTVNIDNVPQHVKEFNRQNTPINDIGLLCTHEYVHTQQNLPVDNLLSYCLYEGIAEFVSTFAINKPSYAPAIRFGADNYEKVRNQFEEDIFITGRTYHWLWSSNQIFGFRDMGYSVGYEIAQRFYRQAADKKAAIKQLIELDYTDEAEVALVVNESHYLSKPLEQLYMEFEKNRPTVLKVEPAFNDQNLVNPDTEIVTLFFSEPMDIKVRGFDFGPLGENNVLKVQEIIGFSEDKKRFSFKVKLEPGKEYQSLATNRFMSEKGYPLKPFLIHFRTAQGK
ncbi:hypothetical protein [Polluticaenibacter yanchengensis]|uniref:DUF2268 domain-containing protein n=1 Tax=Polluticaenibacter yanchengensis TaxID=3014562 RepID=A0ABT4UQM3_9BACT|nr:hypothetical protein [Chitinophagaceae bacterium LY-5]